MDALKAQIVSIHEALASLDSAPSEPPASGSFISIHEALASLDFVANESVEDKPISIHEALASLDAWGLAILERKSDFDPRGSREPRRVLAGGQEYEPDISIHEALASLDNIFSLRKG